MSLIKFVQTKPKVFYNIVALVDKLNSANKNISRYYRVTILQPIIIDNLVAILKSITAVSSKKTQKENYDCLSLCISNIEVAREFFLFFSTKKDVNYSQNFQLQISLDFEEVAKQLHGWKRKFE